MKVGKVIRVVLTAYIALGVAVVLGQAIAISVMEPECSGTARHTLLEGSRVRQIFTWLPDFYREAIRGPMTATNYLLGGFRCEGVGLVDDVESLRDFIQGVPRSTESISSIMAKAAGTSPDAGQPGNKAAALLNVVPKTIELEGVSFDLPGNWREMDREKAEAPFKLKKDDSRPLLVRVYESPDQPPTAMARILIWPKGIDEVRNDTEVFAKKQAGFLEEIGMRNVAVSTASPISVGALPGSHLVLQGDGSEGQRWEYTIVTAHEPAREVQLSFLARIQPVSPHQGALVRLRTSLKIAN